MSISWEDLEPVDMRGGVVVDAQEVPEARQPALKRIGVSEVLVLGVYDDAGDVILLRPDVDVSPGSRIG